MARDERKLLYRMIYTALMAAVVYVATMFLRFEIMTPTGPTNLKTGNIVCLLSGLLFGPVSGGLASGIGSMLFDLSNPAYAASAPLTFVNFFAMGFVCGLIARGGRTQGQSMKRNVVAALSGALSYVALYMLKSVGVLVLAGSGVGAAAVATLPKLATSLTNAAVATVGSVLLAKPLGKALRAIGVYEKL